MVETGASVASVVVALAALWVAFRVEHRSEKRFQAQLDEARKLAEATVRPLLTVHSQVYQNLKSVRMVNRGIGPAVIKKVEFAKGARTTSALVELFDLGRPVVWDTFRRFPPEGSFLAPGEQIDLVKLSEEGMIRQGIAPDLARAILQRWQREKTGIEVKVDYENALGTQQTTYATTLK